MSRTKRECINKDVYEFLKEKIGGDFISCELINVRFSAQKCSISKFSEYHVKEYEFSNFLKNNKILVKDYGFKPSEKKENLYRLILEESYINWHGTKISKDGNKAKINIEFGGCIHRFYTPKGDEAVKNFYSKSRESPASIVGQDLRSVVVFMFYQEGENVINSSKEYRKNIGREIKVK